MSRQNGPREREAMQKAFGELWAGIDPAEAAFDAKKVDVSVVLVGLLEHAGVSRGELARRLDWKPSRVTRVLSGDENLTLRSLFELCRAVGYDFDLLLRPQGARPALQPWQQGSAAGPDQDGAGAAAAVSESGPAARPAARRGGGGVPRKPAGKRGEAALGRD